MASIPSYRLQFIEGIVFLTDVATILMDIITIIDLVMDLIFSTISMAEISEIAIMVMEMMTLITFLTLLMHQISITFMVKYLMFLLLIH